LRGSPKKKPSCAAHSFDFFVFTLLQEQALDESKNKKAVALSAMAFSL